MFGKVTRIVLIAGLAMSLTACASVQQRIFGIQTTDLGLPFRADLTRGETRREFSVTVRAEGASLEDARESARYPATRHCIERFGLSDVDWVLDPATGDWAVTRTENGGLVVSGQCVGR